MPQSQCAILRLLRCGRLGGLLPVTLVEPINPSRRVYQLLFACEKRMAGRANFNVQIAFFRGVCLKTFAARAGDGDLVIVGMNSWFHYSFDLAYSQLNSLFFKHIMIWFECSYRQATQGIRVIASTQKRWNKFVDSDLIACLNPLLPTFSNSIKHLT